MVLIIDNRVASDAYVLDTNKTIVVKIYLEKNYILVKFNQANIIEQVLIDLFNAIKRPNNEYILNTDQYMQLFELVLKYKLIIYIYN